METYEKYEGFPQSCDCLPEAKFWDDKKKQQKLKELEYIYIHIHIYIMHSKIDLSNTTGEFRNKHDALPFKRFN